MSNILILQSSNNSLEINLWFVPKDNLTYLIFFTSL